MQGVTAALARETASPSPGFDRAHRIRRFPLAPACRRARRWRSPAAGACGCCSSFDLDDVAIAQIGAAAETGFRRRASRHHGSDGLSLGRDGEALFLDTRTLAFERLPLPPRCELVVIDSGDSHAHAGGEYGTRRRESFEAAALLGVDTTARPRSSRRSRASRRCRQCWRGAHAMSSRKTSACSTPSQALRAGDAPRWEHCSTRRTLRCATITRPRRPNRHARPTSPSRIRDVYGARLTGGGFGGAVVMRRRGRTAAARVGAAFEMRITSQTGRTRLLLVPPDVSDGSNAGRARFLNTSAMHYALTSSQPSADVICLLTSAVELCVSAAAASDDALRARSAGVFRRRADLTTRHQRRDFDIEQRRAGHRRRAASYPTGLDRSRRETARCAALLDDLFQQQRISDYVLWYYTPMALAFTDHLSPRRRHLRLHGRTVGIQGRAGGAEGTRGRPDAAGRTRV